MLYFFISRTRTRPEAQGIAQLHINGTIKDLFKPPEVKSFRSEWALSTFQTAILYSW